MQFIEVVLLIIPSLALIFCAKPKKIGTLEEVNTKRHHEAYTKMVSNPDMQSFSLETGPEHNRRSFSARIDKVLGMPLVLRRDSRTELILFPQYPTEIRPITFYRDHLSRPNHMWDSLSTVERPSRKSPRKYATVLEEEIIDERIHVWDGDMIVALLPMSNDTDKNLTRKCTPAKIASSYAKSKKASRGARIDTAISKNCKDGTVIPIAIQYRIRKEE